MTEREAITPSQQAILDFAEGCGTLFDSPDGFATVTVDAAMLHEYVWKIAMNHRLQALEEAANACIQVRDEVAAALASLDEHPTNNRFAQTASIVCRGCADAIRSLTPTGEKA